MDVRARGTDGPLKNRFQLATPGGGLAFPPQSGTPQRVWIVGRCGCCFAIGRSLTEAGDQTPCPTRCRLAACWRWVARERGESGRGGGEGSCTPLRRPTKHPAGSHGAVRGRGWRTWNWLLRCILHAPFGVDWRSRVLRKAWRGGLGEGLRRGGGGAGARRAVGRRDTHSRELAGWRRPASAA